MAIALSCPCGKKLSVKDNLAGRRVKCPACLQTLSVPKQETLNTSSPVNSRFQRDQPIAQQKTDSGSTSVNQNEEFSILVLRIVWIVTAVALLAFPWMPMAVRKAFWCWMILLVTVSKLVLPWNRRKREEIRVNRLLSKPGLGLEYFTVLRRNLRLAHLRPEVQVTIDKTDVTLLEFKYRTLGRYQVALHQTVVCLHRPGACVPNFVIHPVGRGLETDLGALIFGPTDINFENHPEFSRKYILRGADVAAVRELFVDNVRNFFEQHSNLTVEAAANRLIYYRNCVMVEQDQYRDFINESIQLMDLLHPSVP